MLQPKRFCYTSFLQLEKLQYPVQYVGDGWYSLVSIISHLGSGAQQGHYVSDGVHPDMELDDPTDRWLIYYDAEVTELQGASVCEQRQHNAERRVTYEFGKRAERMQDHKTNIPYSCGQTLLKISQEKDEEKKAEISRQEREKEKIEKEDRKRRDVNSREMSVQSS
ncbi:ubiquitin carboxyl-terminal hydrolase 37-like isoform X5 [Scomber scombrus]|uniref:Ubiquitin carboxyl-terminal hydrolase 37-like isoform X5 n=1 Tax=Scomber scombrus TaxID=13677 RepID=A0AAV1PQP1_SCOSC